MSKLTTRWLICAALLLSIFVLIRLPASLLTRALPAPLSLANVQGSLWHGSAAALGLNGIVAQENLRWDFLPGALLQGQLRWFVQSELAGQAGKLHLTLGLRQQALDNLQLSLPLEALGASHPTLAGIRLGGTARLESPHLARNQGMNLQISLTQVSSAMTPEPSVLGSYNIIVKADPSGAGTLEFLPQSGPLRISGGGKFALADQSLDLSLLLKPEGELPGFASLLATLPKEQEGYRLAFKRP